MELSISTAVISAIFITMLVCWLVARALLNKQKSECLTLESRVRDFEKQIHLNEAKFLELQNEIKKGHLEELEKSNASAYDKGFAGGKSQSEKEFQVLIKQLENDHQVKTRQACDEAAAAARRQLQAEFEAQTKLFSVSIKPYVKIEKNKGFIWDDFKSHTGYQYQLLVNGIPVFQPHVIVEHSEETKEVNEEKLGKLVEAAKTAANHAASLYLAGASNSAFKMGAPIVENMAKIPVPAE